MKSYICLSLTRGGVYEAYTILKGNEIIKIYCIIRRGVSLDPVKKAGPKPIF